MNKGKEGEKDGQKNMKMEKQEDLKKKKKWGTGRYKRRPRVLLIAFPLE
jgi:hypothetical protein